MGLIYRDPSTGVLVEKGLDGKYRPYNGPPPVPFDPNTLDKTLRTAFGPELSGALDAAAEQPVEAPPVEPSDPDLIDAIQRGAGRGMAAVGTVAEDITGYGSGLREYGEEVARANASDITTAGEAFRRAPEFIAETVAEQVPTLPFTIGGAFGGAALGAPLGPPGMLVGGAVGAFLPSLVQEYGEIRGAQRERGQEDKLRALAYATPAAALDLLGPEALILKRAAKVGRNLAPDASRIGHALKQGAVAGAVEAPTEVVQTGLERAGAGQDVFDPKATDEYLMAGLGGLGAGTVIGGGVAATTPREQANPAQASAADPVAQPPAPTTSVPNQGTPVPNVGEMPTATPEQVAGRTAQSLEAATNNAALRNAKGEDVVTFRHPTVADRYVNLPRPEKAPEQPAAEVAPTPQPAPEPAQPKPSEALAAIATTIPEPDVRRQVERASTVQAIREIVTGEPAPLPPIAPEPTPFVPQPPPPPPDFATPIDPNLAAAFEQAQRDDVVAKAVAASNAQNPLPTLESHNASRAEAGLPPITQAQFTRPPSGSPLEPVSAQTPQNEPVVEPTAAVVPATTEPVQAPRKLSPAQKRAAKRAAAAKIPAKTSQELEQRVHRNIFGIIRGLGGIEIAERADITGEKASAGGLHMTLFRKGGVPIDAVMERFAEAGFLTESEQADVTGGTQRTRDIIRAAIQNEPFVPPAWENEHNALKLQEQAAHDEQARVEQKRLDAEAEQAAAAEMDQLRSGSAMTQDEMAALDDPDPEEVYASGTNDEQLAVDLTQQAKAMNPDAAEAVSDNLTTQQVIAAMRRIIEDGHGKATAQELPAAPPEGQVVSPVHQGAGGETGRAPGEEETALEQPKSSLFSRVTRDRDVDAGRRDFLISMAAIAAMPLGVSYYNKTDAATLGKAKALSARLMGQPVDAQAEKILRGNGATNPDGATAIKAALDRIATDGPVELRALAKSISSLMPGSGVMLTVDDVRPMNAHGAVQYGDRPTHLQLFTAGGRTGLTYGTFLHEAMHVAVLARYRDLSSGLIRKNDKVLGLDAPAAAPEMEQFYQLWREFKESVKDDSSLDEKTALSISEARNDPDEFFVRALTDPRLQEHLSTIEYRGKTLLERFKDWVKTNLFGKVSGGVRPSWLDAALAASADLATGMTRDNPDFARLKATNEHVASRNKSALYSRATEDFKLTAQQRTEEQSDAELKQEALANQGDLLGGQTDAAKEAKARETAKRQAAAPGPGRFELRQGQEQYSELRALYDEFSDDGTIDGDDATLDELIDLIEKDGISVPTEVGKAIDKYLRDRNSDMGRKFGQRMDSQGDPDLVEAAIQKALGYNAADETALAKQPTTGDRGTGPSAGVGVRGATDEVRTESAGTEAGAGGRFLAKGNNLQAQIAKSGSASIIGQDVSTPEKLASVAQVMRDTTKELFRFIFTKGGKVVHVNTITASLPGKTFMFPADMSDAEGYEWARAEMNRPGVEADGFYILHNHPAGDPKATYSDRQATRRASANLPNFLGHVIIDSNAYTVLNAKGEGDVIKADFGPDLLLTPEVPSPYIGVSITSPGQVAGIGFRLKKPEWVVVVGTAGESGVRAILEVPSSQFATDAKKVLEQFQKTTGSDKIFAYGAAADLKGARALMDDGYLFDAIDTSGKSLHLGDRPANEKMNMGRKVSDLATLVEQPAYHGTPHEIGPEGFSLLKVGTGEGAQAFGFGLYFAENPRVAEEYRRVLSGRYNGARVWLDGKEPDFDRVDSVEGDDIASSAMFSLAELGGFYPGDLDSVLYEMRNAGNDAEADWLKANADRVKWEPTTKGALYQVDIADEAIAKMLDWDKPLSEQPESVREALAGVARGLSDNTGAGIYQYLSRTKGSDKTFTGGWSGRVSNDEAASKYLNSLGIPGIRYKDEGSRGKPEWSVVVPGREMSHLTEKSARAAAEKHNAELTPLDRKHGGEAKVVYHAPTRNIVVFDEKIVTITHKDGSPVTKAERETVLEQGGAGYGQKFRVVAINKDTGERFVLKSALTRRQAETAADAEQARDRYSSDRIAVEGYEDNAVEQTSPPYEANNPHSLPNPETDSQYAEENRRIREEHITTWDKAKKWLKRNLTPGGLLPDAAFDAKIARDSEFEAVEFDVAHLIGQLEIAIKKDYGVSARKLDEQTTKMLGDALAGRVTATIPEGTKTVMLAMRQYIDGLSLQYTKQLNEELTDIRTTFDPGELALYDATIEAGKRDMLGDGQEYNQEQRDELLNEAKEKAKKIWGDGKRMMSAVAKVNQAAERAFRIMTIQSNIGEYVHRSYQAFDDPKWHTKVSDEVLNAARRYLTERYTESGELDVKAKVESVLNEILKNGTAYSNITTFIRESTLGSKDLRILKRRKVIAPEIRALLGEHTDPRLNFAKTATKLGRLIWNQAFLNRILENGVDVFLWTHATKPAEATEQIAADHSEPMAPLNGMWVTPDVKQAFIDALGKEQMSNWYRVVVQLNGAVKWGKTVGSPTTAARNWMSAFFFTVANGHFDLRHMGKSVAGFREYFTHQGSAERIAYLRELKQLGVVYDTPYAGEMMRLLEDTKVTDTLMQSKARFTVGEAIRLATKFYQYGDDFWKIIGFENEKQMWMGAGLSEADAKAKAAERVRNTYPTYSMVGRAMHWLRRFPLAGTFVSFPAEIIRTTGNMLRYVAEDLKSSNPKVRMMGMKRAVGLSIVSSMAYAAQAATMAMLGYDDEDDEAVRKMAAPWQRNASFIFTGRDKDGNIRFLDASFLDPYNYWKRPLMAITRDQPWDARLKDAVLEAFTPFFGVDIAAGVIFEVLANKKSSGGPVFDPHNPPADQMKAIADHLRKTLQPGIASNVERTLRALDGEKKLVGHPYKIEDELAAWVGFRVSTLDPKTALYYRSFEFKDAKTAANRSIRKVVTDLNKVSRGDLEDAYNRTLRIRKEAFDEMTLLVKAAERAGLKRNEVVEVLKNSKVSDDDLGAILSGRVQPWKPDPTDVKEQAAKVRPIGGQEAVREVYRRYQELSDIDRQERAKGAKARAAEEAKKVEKMNLSEAKTYFKDGGMEATAALLETLPADLRLPA